MSSVPSFPSLDFKSCFSCGWVWVNDPLRVDLAAILPHKDSQKFDILHGVFLTMGGVPGALLKPIPCLHPYLMRGDHTVWPEDLYMGARDSQ